MFFSRGSPFFWFISLLCLQFFCWFLVHRTAAPSMRRSREVALCAAFVLGISAKSFFLNWLVVLNHFSVATGNARCFISNDSELVQMEYISAWKRCEGLGWGLRGTGPAGGCSGCTCARAGRARAGSLAPVPGSVPSLRGGQLPWPCGWAPGRWAEGLSAAERFAALLSIASGCDTAGAAGVLRFPREHDAFGSAAAAADVADVP